MALLIYKSSIAYFLKKYYIFRYGYCGLSLVILCSLVAVLTEYDKEKTVTHPFTNYTVVMFAQGYVMVFCFCINLSIRGAMKAATPNCVPYL